MSNYVCNWGNGCKGINSKSPDLGCCANGAYLTEEDEKLLALRVPELTADTWQHFRNEWMEVGESQDDDVVVHKTAVVDKTSDISGCVFANRPGFAAGVGCALHAEALRRNENPMDWKPEICWHMPLDVDYIEDANIHILRQYYWAEDEYDWFCAHDDANWVGESPIYQTMGKELERMIGLYGDKDAYPKIKSLLDSVWEQHHQTPIKKRIPVTVVFD